MNTVVEVRVVEPRLDHAPCPCPACGVDLRDSVQVTHVETACDSRGRLRFELIVQCHACMSCWEGELWFDRMRPCPVG